MPQPPSPEPDPSTPDLSATGVLRAQPNDPQPNSPQPSGPEPSHSQPCNPQPSDARFETDFAQLAACFSAQSGGGLSRELSTDLALEIVLNEVVEQACLTTGATGAAIALERDGEMICRGSSGATAPPLGSRLEASSRLLAESIRTRRTLRSDDALADSRIDLEPLQRLGVRSVMVMPLLRRDELVGLFELFSSLPNAFGERDELTLGALSLRILSSLERAAGPLLPQSEPFPLPEIKEFVPEIPSEIPPEISKTALPENLPEIADGTSARRGFDFVTWALRAAVLVSAVMLGLLLGRHLVSGKTPRRHSIATETAAGNAAVAPVPPPVAEKQEPPAPAPPATPAGKSEEPVPPGSLLVFENGKEIFRMTPARGGALPKQMATSAKGGSGVQRAASRERETSVAENSAGLSSPAAGSLVHRVEPEYPSDARERKIQGALVLDVQIGPDGAVQDATVLSGPPELAQSAIDAVKQWRFKPRLVKGSAVPMQTKITLNFRLPQ